MGVQFSANVQKLFDSRPDKTRVIDGNRTLSWPFIDRRAVLLSRCGFACPREKNDDQNIFRRMCVRRDPI